MQAGSPASVGERAGDNQSMFLSLSLPLPSIVSKFQWKKYPSIRINNKKDGITKEDVIGIELDMLDFYLIPISYFLSIRPISVSCVQRAPISHLFLFSELGEQQPFLCPFNSDCSTFPFLLSSPAVLDILTYFIASIFRLVFTI